MVETAFRVLCWSIIVGSVLWSAVLLYPEWRRWREWREYVKKYRRWRGY